MISWLAPLSQIDTIIFFDALNEMKPHNFVYISTPKN